MKIKPRHNSWISLASALALLAVVLLVFPVCAQITNETITGSEENSLTSVKGAYSSANEDGDFRVTWPSGCANVRTRTPMRDNSPVDGPEPEYPVIVSCDRHDEKGEGCSVTAIFNVKRNNKGTVGPGEVIPRLQKTLQGLGAVVKHQSPLSKDFGDGLIAEGIEILAAQPQGSGQVWLRGLVVGGDIYILAAWSLEGGVWENPEYMTFFNSFQPGAD